MGDEGTGADEYRLLPFRSPAALEMREYSRWFRGTVRQRGDDTTLLAQLAEARIGGEALSQADYDAMFLLLVVAGNETHRCLGEHLARLEIRVVLAELLGKVSRLELTGPPNRIRSNFTNGLKSLPVRVEPAR